MDPKPRPPSRLSERLKSQRSGGGGGRGSSTIAPQSLPPPQQASPTSYASRSFGASKSSPRIVRKPAHAAEQSASEVFRFATDARLNALETQRQQLLHGALSGSMNPTSSASSPQLGGGGGGGRGGGGIYGGNLIGGARASTAVMMPTIQERQHPALERQQQRAMTSPRRVELLRDPRSRTPHRRLPPLSHKVTYSAMPRL